MANVRRLTLTIAGVLAGGVIAVATVLALTGGSTPSKYAYDDPDELHLPGRKYKVHPVDPFLSDPVPPVIDVVPATPPDAAPPPPPPPPPDPVVAPPVLPEVDELAVLRVIGPRSGQMGALFAGLALDDGTTSDPPSHVEARFESFQQTWSGEVEVDRDLSSLDSFAVTFEGHSLRAPLTRAWGPPGEPPNTWFDPARHIRAVLDEDSDGATLTFSKYQTLVELVAPGDRTKLGAEPFPLLGARASRVRARIGRHLLPPDEDEPDALSWSVPPIDAEDSSTDFVASVENGAVTRVSITVWIDNETRASMMMAALRMKWGTPDGPIDDVFTWHRAGVTITAERVRDLSVDIVFERETP